MRSSFQTERCHLHTRLTFLFLTLVRRFRCFSLAAPIGRPNPDPYTISQDLRFPTMAAPAQPGDTRKTSTRPWLPARRLVSRKSSPTLRTTSTFDPVNILPKQTGLKVLPEDFPRPPRRDSVSPLNLGTAGPRPRVKISSGALSMSGPVSPSPPSIFDNFDGTHDQQELLTEPTTALGSAEEQSYDLKPPPPSVSQANVEALSERLFSVDHLDTILQNQATAARLRAFLNQFRPQYAESLVRYVETKKAITAVQYANAIAESIPTTPGHPPYLAATLDDRFEAKSRRVVEDLVDEALPAYITNRLTTLVTDTLVKEITGNNAPVMRELVPSLAEVYCVTDPSLPDNPIVYASEGEFAHSK
jgi:hypothetical protein